MRGNKGILMISPFFSPNIGGVETYLDDYVEELAKNNKVYVLTYQPITCCRRGKSHEIRENIEIIRYNYIGYNLFHKLRRWPILVFLYITPYLLIRCFWWMWWNNDKIDTIHAQGLNAAFIAMILKPFGKYTVMSTQCLYGKIGKVAMVVLHSMNHIYAQSLESVSELVGAGIDYRKITAFTHKVKDRFTPIRVFIVLWVGRLIPEKGVDVFLEVAKRMKDEDMLFLMVGDRYLEAENVYIIRGVDNKRLPLFYNIADVLLICTKAEEVMRTQLEAEACQLPVIQETDVEKIIHHIKVLRKQS